MTPTGKILICSIRGGGVDGALAAGTASALATAYPDFPACVDVWAGTSIGSMAAAMLACGRSPADVIDLFLKRGADCFTRDLARFIGRGFITAKWDGVGLQQVLMDTFGAMTLGDVPKGLVVPTTMVSGPQAKVVLLHNLPGSPWLKMPVALACRMSAAAEGFFPGVNCNGDAYWDGGNGCNDPIAAALDAHQLTSGVGDDGYAGIDLGCGTDATGIDPNDLDLGFARVVSSLAATMIDGNESDAVASAEARLGTRYVSFVGEPTGQDSVDDWTIIPQRIKDGAATDVSTAAPIFATIGS